MILRDPPALEARFDWNQVVEAWQAELSHLGSPPESEPHFVDIVVQPPPEGFRTLRDEVLDWWPAEDIEKRHLSLNRSGTAGINWNSYAGTLHTIDLLWKARGNNDRLTAVWMAAFARDLRQGKDRSWKGSTREVIDRLYSLALDQLIRSGSTEWHHATKNALPISLFNSPGARALVPTEFRHFVMLGVITMNLCRTSWVPVRIARKG